MNKYIILIFLMTISFCDAGAMIGDTEAEMARRSGSPSGKTDEGYNIYHNGDLEIHAHFTDRVCDNTIYIADPKIGFTDHIVSMALCVESSGLAWIVDENSIPERVMYSTPKGEFHAILLSRCKLSVFTDAYYKKRKRETGH